MRAVWFGIPGDASERLAALDGAVDEAFAGFGLDGPTPLILFRESTVAGRFVGITAIDGVGEHVILRSGRLPRTCTPDRCEVLRLRGRGALPSAPGLRIVEVGTGTLRSRQLYGDFLLSSDAATADATVPPELGETSEYHRPPPAPLVVAEGRAALASAAELARTYRTYAWVWPIGPGSPRLWDVDELVQRSERARVELTRALVVVRGRGARGRAERDRARGERRRDASPPRRRGRRGASARVHDPRCTRHAP